MDNFLIDKGLIPLDKSWTIRVGVLDLINGYKDTITFLEKQNDLGSDLKALLNASKQWNSSKVINVGESGTLLRFLQFASWKLNLDKTFIKEGTLRDRNINLDKSIINYSIPKLLTLDNNTSQWASASVLLGNKEKIENPPYKLKLTYETINHWKEMRAKNKTWVPRYDETILNQAQSFLKMRKTGKIEFIPKQSEDYCFARAFNLMTEDQAKEIWPSLAGHESNRFEEMERCLNEAKNELTVRTNDHRIVQAISMLYYKKQIKFSNMECVNKSWPQFWNFMEYSKKI